MTIELPAALTVEGLLRFFGSAGVPEGAPVIACVSGGVDSMCLLELLRRASREAGFPLYAAHYNHRLRGEDSDGDEAFVRDWCDARRIPLHTASGDVAGEARRTGRGIEETAREMRYAFFHALSRQLGGAYLATAHNADDDLETVLLRIARGTGLRGLGGIPPVSGCLLRPLLGIPRREIEAWCRENGVPHREDATNALDDCARNRLRHAVVPVLKELNPALNVSTMTALLRRDEEFLTRLAESFVKDHAVPGGVDAAALAALPYPLASRAVRRLFGEKLAAVHVDAALKLAASPDPSGELHLPGVTLRREYGLLTALPPGPVTFEPVEIPLDKPVIIENIRLKITAALCEKAEIYNSLTKFTIKRDTIKDGLTARPRQTGDELRLHGGSKSVKRLMIDRKLPAKSRDAVPVIVSGDRVLAVYGLGQSVDTLPDAGEPAVVITIEKWEDQDYVGKGY